MVINQLVMNQKYLFKLNKNIDRRICYNVDELHEI